MPGGNNDVVLVTGAGGGLGLETVLTLAQRGFRVFAGVRDPESRGRIEDAARKRGLAVYAVVLDVDDDASAAAAVRHVVEAAGGLFAAVNIAGVQVRGYFEDLDETEIRRVFEVNVFGAMRVTREVLPYLREARRGRIVMMSSVAGRVGSMGLSAYVASKFALEGFAESLALEVQPLGIGVSIVEPGIVRTDIWGRSRNVAARALDPSGPYHEWFTRAEREADRLVETSTLTPRLVAEEVVRALTEPRPRLRYVVGSRASLVVSLRRHLPGELFERLYFGEVLRRVTGRRHAEGPGQGHQRA
jgi:NAD(P)-dependent dehydrogenase (short-subunit alcohol dehydrogenase family)